MQKTTTTARGLSLRGLAFGGAKVRTRKKKPPHPYPQPRIMGAKSSSSLVGEVPPNLVKIATVDALVQELRASLHSLFVALDPNILTTNLHDNCAQQAFRFFTTTNSITPEAFHHKINKLGLHASQKLCCELFRLVDQEDLGELTYAMFVRRIFLPAGYVNFSKPSTPVIGTGIAAAVASPQRPLSAERRSSSRTKPTSTPRPSTPRTPRTPRTPQTPRGGGHGGDGGGSASLHLVYENKTLTEIEQCISRKLEQRTSRTTDRFRQAFRIFTKSEGITFRDFFYQLSSMQIHLSETKCRELFDRFDLDRNGTIELSEFTLALFRHEEDEAVLLQPSTPQYHQQRTTAPAPATTGGALQSPQHHSSFSQPYHQPHAFRLEDFEVEAGATLTIQQILTKLRDKLEQHTSKEADRFRQAFRIFGKSSGVTPHEFNAAMAKLGLKLSDCQVHELFVLFDFDKSGDLDLNEFVQGVMLDESSTRHWYAIKDKQKLEESRLQRYSMAVQSVQQSWTIAEIEQMLREKIEQRTSRSSDCFRQAFRVFKKVNGIKPQEFHAALETIGLALSREQADVLFQRFDKDGSGDIDLDEFIHGILPPDYTGRQWVAAADELHREAAFKKKEDAILNKKDRFMTEVEMENWSLDEIEKRIRDKIQQATSKSSDTFRQAYKIFKKTNHVTIDEFRERLLALGFRLTPSQCLGLFQRYDTNNSHDIDLQEFCMKILPPDYTGDGDHWSHSAKFHKQQQREKLEYVKRTKNGLLHLPKFEESRVRYTRGQHEPRSFADLEESEASGLRPASPVTSRSSTPRAYHLRPTSVSSSSSTCQSQQTTAAAEIVPLSSPRVRHLHLQQQQQQQRPLTPTSPRSEASCRPMSPRVGTVAVGSQHSGNNSPRAPSAATPPRPPPPSPSHTTSPRQQQTPERPTTPQRPMTPRRQPPPQPLQHRQDHDYEEQEDEQDDDDEVVFEDTEERDDDEADEQLTSHALRVLRARRIESANRHRQHHAHHPRSSRTGTATAESLGSVAGESTASFSSSVSRVVHTAKFTPMQSNVLLLQRFMRAAATRPSVAASSKQVVEGDRQATTTTKRRMVPPHTSRV